ncbi:MAG: thiamine ABC transporter ATP-binding protein [Proteobacteria bacterium SG_bin7]|nr:MAG: thiamine ABC transporter ATP-binding protein [Proteobacteria bacterium SG_bin7]
MPDTGVSALWGPSGAGKTSVFRVLLGLDACESLDWNFKGINIAKLSVPERRLGVVFQSYELFPHLTARDNIVFAAKARKLNDKNISDHLAKLVSDLKLDTFLFRRAHQLSGGEQQRVALARALIGEPRFLFLDEPFSALDSDLRNEARSLVQSVITQRKIPSLLITHDQDDLKIAQKTFKINNGRLVDTV